jgi:hypothetical protein
VIEEKQSIDWFTYFKYAIYIALLCNVVLFFIDDWQAAAHVFQDSLPLSQVISAFAPSIDTAAWVLLLFVFELESYQIPDEKLTLSLSRRLAIFRALCYVVIVYALYGYLTTVLGFSSYQQFSYGVANDVCDLAKDGYAVLITLDEYKPLDAAACAELSREVFINSEARLLSDTDALSDTILLAWADLINSATWILIVVMLELDVRLGVKGLLTTTYRRLSTRAKFFLYAVLLSVAIYWGFYGAFLDFWDAALWIAAFVFIERNIFKWEEELRLHTPTRSEHA